MLQVSFGEWLGIDLGLGVPVILKEMENRYYVVLTGKLDVCVA